MWVVPPNEACDLVDLGVVAVRIGPAHPGCDTVVRVVNDDKRPQRNGTDDFDGTNGHQADVPTAAETLRSRHQLAELTLALIE